MTDDLLRIRRFIDALTRRERALLLARVLLQLGVLAVVVQVVAVAAAAIRADRPLATAAVVLLAGIGVWLAAVLPLALRWPRTGDARRQARLVEELTPELRGRLLTSVERTDGPLGAESPAMLGLVARRAVGMIGGVRPGRVHSSSSVLRLAVLSALTTLFGLIVMAAAPQGLSGTLRWWFAGEGAHAAVEGLSFEEEQELARVGDLVLRYVYPDYTGLEPMQIANSTGDAHGPPGTVVEVSARSAMPIEAAALAAYDEPPLDASVQEGRLLSGAFTIRQEPGFYHLVTYRNGEPRKSRPFTITSEPDLPPDVTVDAEADVLEVALDEPIVLEWRARDDFGVSRITLTIDGREHSPALSVPDVRKAEAQGVLSTRPYRLGLSEGDRVELRVVAWDNDTYSGSKPGVSRAIEVIVLGARGLDERAAERQEELRDLMLDVLADHLEEPWPVARTEAELMGWGEILATRYAPLDEAVEIWSSTMSTDTVEGKAIEKVRRTGRELIRYTQVAFEPNSSSRPSDEDFAVTTSLRDEAILALEDGIIALDQLVQARALRFVVEDAQMLATAAENIAEMMEGDVDPLELLSRLDRLEALLDRLLESASRLEEGGMKEFVNQREGEMRSMMDEIRKAVAEGRMEDAQRMMEQLARQLQQMSDGVQDNLERMTGEADDSMEKMQDYMERLEELEKKQLALQEEVRELREQADSQAAEQAEDLWEAIDERAQALAEKGAEYVEDLEKAGRTFDEAEVARGASEKLERVGESADARDLRGLQRALLESKRDWYLAEDRLRRHETIRGDKLPGPGREEIGRIQREIAELEDLIEKMEKLSERIDPSTQREVREQREAQDAMQQEAQDMAAEGQELMRDMPVRPDGFEEAMEDAEGQMGQAGEELGKGRAMQAEGSQGMAAQRLHDAQQSLEQAMQQMQQMQQEMQPREGGGDKPGEDGQSEGDEEGERESDPHAQIELPSPEEFRTPEEYRRALLEGMEGDVPEEYRALKKRYYEELVHQ